jgi:hypothetical protein
MAVLARVATAVVGAGAAAVGWAYAATRDVQECSVPVDSLLHYVGQTQRFWYTDCYRTTIPVEAVGNVSRTGTTDAYLRAFMRLVSAISH